MALNFDKKNQPNIFLGKFSKFFKITVLLRILRDWFCICKKKNPRYRQSNVGNWYSEKNLHDIATETYDTVC